MDNILFLAHTEADGTLNKAALEALSSAVELKQALGGTLDVALFGAQIQPAANSIAACGATRFFAVGGEAFGPARFPPDAAGSEALVKASPGCSWRSSLDGSGGHACRYVALRDDEQHHCW